MSLKVLQLISSGGFFGAESVLLELSAELEIKGHQVVIGIFNNYHQPNLDLMERAKRLLLRVEPFTCRGRADLKTVFKIASFIRENSIDIIHSHGYKANIYALLSNIGNKKPLVATCHNWINSNSKMYLYSFLDKIALRKFDRVVSVSASVKELALKSGINPNRLTVIENGVDVSKFKSPGDVDLLRGEFGLKRSDRVFGTVGRLSEEKGHKILLKGFKRVLEVRDDCKLLIVGEGEQRESLKQETRNLGIKNQVIFTGNREDIPALLSLMDVFVLPSLMEAQPVALLEAMAAGKPTIATRVGDVDRILKNGELGFLIPPGDPKAIAEGLFFYMNNPEKAKQLGEFSSRWIVEQFSSARMTREYLKIYTSLNS